MVKAVITLPNGTEVTIDGTTEEVQSLLEHYGGNNKKPAINTKRKTNKAAQKSKSSNDSNEGSNIDLTAVVNLVKNCDEAEAIETQILDRASQVDRTLLPLYIVHEYLDGDVVLSSGDISQVTRDLGVPISQPNASRALTGTASKYVMADGVRKKGTKLSYKLSRRGVTYLKGVIDGKSNEK